MRRLPKNKLEHGKERRALVPFRRGELFLLKVRNDGPDVPGMKLPESPAKILFLSGLCRTRRPCQGCALRPRTVRPNSPSCSLSLPPLPYLFVGSLVANAPPVWTECEGKDGTKSPRNRQAHVASPEGQLPQPPEEMTLC